MEDFDLESAREDDLDKIQQIAEEGGLCHYPKPVLRWLIREKFIMAAKKGGRTIAYFSYLIFPWIKRAFLLQIGIKKEHRGKGLGSKLLTLLCQKMKRENGTKEIFAHTLKPRVVKLFQRQRWSVFARFFGVAVVQKAIK